MAKVWIRCQQFDIEAHVGSVKFEKIYNQPSDAELFK